MELQAEATPGRNSFGGKQIFGTELAEIDSWDRDEEAGMENPGGGSAHQRPYGFRLHSRCAAETGSRFGQEIRKL